MKKTVTILLAGILIFPHLFQPAAYAEAVPAEREIIGGHSFLPENLNRGLVAAATAPDLNDGIYLSWRLLGNEAIDNQPFDIYRNGTKIATTGRSDATNYVDSGGTDSDRYQVVKTGETCRPENDVRVWTNAGKGKNNSLINSYAYLDIALERPASLVMQAIRKNSGGFYLEDENVSYSPNDTSAADLDGDGDYELIVKWDPSNSKDNSAVGLTAPVILDAYDVDYSSGAAKKLWRINLGQNIRSGAHYNPFIVYDLDQDGRAELAVKTAPGSVDGLGRFVSEAGVSDKIRSTDNTAFYTSYRMIGDLEVPEGIINAGPEYLTVFDGLTGEAVTTVDYWPARNITDFGDDYANRSERYLASVAYLDGETPTLIMHRGYYTSSFAAAYQFDGSSLRRIWIHESTETGSTVTYSDGTVKAGEKTLYGAGNHSLAVADMDHDGKDEIIFGSAVLDDDGTVLTVSGRGHGDALHVSDFDNDGNIEIFGVHEDSPNYSVDLRRWNTEEKREEDLALKGLPGEDVGRGIIDNFDDEYAVRHPDASAIFWSYTDDGSFSETESFDTKGNEVGKRTNHTNFAIYWDGDLSRELLDGRILEKYSTEGGNRSFRFGQLPFFPGVGANNSTKGNPCLQADLLGDWREEIVYRRSDNEGLRIFMSTIPTEYRLPTLMSDREYRLSIVWQNNGYNQPPHTSYYIGSLALAKNAEGSCLNYLRPEIACGIYDESKRS